MRDADVLAFPACEPDVCDQCAHDPHKHDCDAALYDRHDQPAKCSCEGMDGDA